MHTSSTFDLSWTQSWRHTHTEEHIYIYIYTHTHTHTYTHTHLYLRVCLCACACICLCVSVCMYYTFTYIYTHTYIHTYIHTYTCMNACVCVCNKKKWPIKNFSRRQTQFRFPSKNAWWQFCGCICTWILEKMLARTMLQEKITGFPMRFPRISR